jgi:hypothetical protein
MANPPPKPPGPDNNRPPQGKLTRSNQHRQPPPDPPLSPFQQLLAAMDEHSRLQLLQAIQIFQVDTSDSFMMILLSQATIAQALVEAPAKINAAMQEALREGVALMDHYAQKSGELNVQEHAAAMAKGAARLFERRQSQQEMSGLAPLAIPMLSFCSVLLVATGTVGGWVFSQYQRSPIVTDKPIHLTQHQVDDLRWMSTEQGQLAKNLVTWNDGQIVACQKNQTALFQSGDITVTGYGKVKSGACMLWVVPPGSRQFEPEDKK